MRTLFSDPVKFEQMEKGTCCYSVHVKNDFYCSLWHAVRIHRLLGLYVSFFFFHSG